MQALILAGGEGTRLRPLTLTMPKPAIQLVDRPFLRHMVDWLHRYGVDDVVIASGFGAAESTAPSSMASIVASPQAPQGGIDKSGIIPPATGSAISAGARVCCETRAPLRKFLAKSVCADFQECPSSRGSTTRRDRRRVMVRCGGR